MIAVAVAAFAWAPGVCAADTAPEPRPPIVAPTADTADTVVELNEAGADHYARGRYRLAVEKFVQALALSDDPNLLFNIANCYERLGDEAAAIEKYRAFLTSPRADPAGRPRAERALARLVPAPGSAPPVVDERAEVATSVPPASIERDAGTPSLWRQSLPWITLGGGAALSAVGISLYAMGARDHARVTGADGHGDPSRISSLTRSRADELVESGSSKKALGVTSMVLGGALLATYGVLYFFERRPPGEALPRPRLGDAPPTAVRVGVAPLEHGGVVSLAGAF